jgi:magnesium chelatase subunit I
LLNVMEERDIQVRGYTLRLPLDVLLVATANPEDYTNRGRIITPLKDRFGAQVRTHYPLDVGTELEVVDQEARPPGIPGVEVHVPAFMRDIVAAITHGARSSPHVNQRSGVSVRVTIANHETLVASAVRRGLRLGEKDAVPRVSDLAALASSTMGKVEIDALEEGREQAILDGIVEAAVLSVFKQRCSLSTLADVVLAFDEGTVVHTGDDLPSAAYADALTTVPPLRATALDLAGEESPAAVASAVEFILEGLHLAKRLNKDAVGAGALYRAR